MNGFEIKVCGKFTFDEIVKILKNQGLIVEGKPSKYLHSDGEWYPFKEVPNYFVYEFDTGDGTTEYYLVPDAMSLIDAFFHEQYSIRAAEGVLWADDRGSEEHQPVQYPLSVAAIKMLKAPPKGCEAQIYTYNQGFLLDRRPERFFAIPIPTGDFNRVDPLHSKDGEPLIPAGAWELKDGAWVRCEGAASKSA